MTAVPRNFALTKLAAGDWLLPSNDASPFDGGAGWLYRLTSWEDGPELGAERRRTVWRIRRIPFANGISRSEVDELAWEDLAERPTRQQAIDHALNHAILNPPPAP